MISKDHKTTFCRIAFTCWTLLACATLPCTADMIIQGYDPNRHDRFDTDRMGTSFIGSITVTGVTSPLDFSGVGRATSGGQWATMITATHFVTARHFVPSGTVTFYEENDATDTPITCTILGGQPIGTTDIWVGSVQVGGACDTSLIAQYPIAMPGSHLGKTVYQVGKSSTASGSSDNSDNTTKVRIGRNKLTQILNNTAAITRVGDWAVYADDSLDGDLVAPLTATADEFNPDETFYVPGDSGGPSFLVNADGSMEIIGIHSWKDDNVSNLVIPGRRSSGDAYLTGHRSAILAVAVPEPSPMLYLGMISVGCCCFQQRRRRYGRGGWC